MKNVKLNTVQKNNNNNDKKIINRKRKEKGENGVNKS